MEILPIEFSPEDRVWVNECMDRLETGLHWGTVRDEEEALGGEQNALRVASPAEKGAGLQWPEPPSPYAPLALADELLAWSERHELAAGRGARGVVAHGVHRLSRWFLDLVRHPQVESGEEGEHLVRALAAQRAALLYTRFHALELPKTAGGLLQVMLDSQVPSAIALGVDLLVTSPPSDWRDTSHAISGLMRSRHWDLRDVFPRLLDATDPAVLSPALDLANHMAAKWSVNPHPAASQFDRFLTLLGGVTQQLASLEENPARYSDRVAEIQRILFDAVSLAVSLCHFFALQGDSRAVAKLTQTLDLRHRRIKVEAAYALAKLGEDRARELLLELLEDDAIRPRALAYAEELGMEGRIDAQWHTSLAAARSQLALWLSQPENLAIPPSKMQLVEQRTLYWPGYDGPQECFLFRFEYQWGENRYSNLGIAGPTTHAFAEDLSNLSTDDAFAIFLAHDIDHPEAYELAPVDWRDAEHRVVERWTAQLEAQGYSVTEFLFLGRFFDALALLASARTPAGTEQKILFDGERVLNNPLQQQSVELLYLAWKGRMAMSLLNNRAEVDDEVDVDESEES